MNITKELKKLDIGEIIENVDVKKYTTYKVGGNALALVKPKNKIM